MIGKQARYALLVTKPFESRNAQGTGQSFYDAHEKVIPWWCERPLLTVECVGQRQVPHQETSRGGLPYKACQQGWDGAGLWEGWASETPQRTGCTNRA